MVKVPDEIHRRGNRRIYEGPRLLVRRGLSQAANDNGRIVARLEFDRFCFRHSIYGIQLPGALETAAPVLLGILWSSIPRYFLWLTTGSWGMWHDEIHKEGIERIPVRLPRDRAMQDRIVRVVERLRVFDTSPSDLLGEAHAQPSSNTDGEIRKLEAELDDAIFDLYQLTDAERDVVRDMCDVGLELFYRGTESDAVKPVSDLADRPNVGRRGDLQHKRAAQRGLGGYLDAFLEIWDAELGPGGQFRWRVICPSDSSPMLAVVFSTEDKDDPLPDPDDTDDEAWSVLLTELAQISLRPLDSKRIYIDGMTRIVGENDIAIIKSNERRLWTRTAAREDAEATQLTAVHEQRAWLREKAV